MTDEEAEEEGTYQQNLERRGWLRPEEARKLRDADKEAAIIAERNAQLRDEVAKLRAALVGLSNRNGCFNGCDAAQYGPDEKHLPSCAAAKAALK